MAQRRSDRPVNLDPTAEAARHIIDWAMFGAAFGVLFDMLPHATIILAFLWWFERWFRASRWRQFLYARFSAWLKR